MADVSSALGASGKIDRLAVVKAGLDNALAVGVESGDGKIFVKNMYTGKNLFVGAESIRHGLGGHSARMRTNARIGMKIGEIVQRAVPINALSNTGTDVIGTYAMAAYAKSPEGREYVVVVTVEQRSSEVVSVDTYDSVHSVNGRIKKGSPVDAKSQGLIPTDATTISIADFLEVVNSTHQSILSEDVLKHFGETRNPAGYYSESAKFSLPDDPDTVVYNRTAILKEETIDRYLQDYAAPGTPNYAQAYIAYMDPDDFLSLTTSMAGRYRIENESRPLNEEEFAEFTSQQVPIQLRINHETGEVEGHEGRHRCVALRDAGIEKVPVLMFDSSNKYNKEPIGMLMLTGQFNRYVQDYVHDMIPLSYGNRDEVIQKFGTQPTSERFYERYRGQRTLRYSISDDEPLVTDSERSVQKVTVADVDVLREIGRKSVNEFSSEEISKAEPWAKKFYSELGEKSPFFRAWFGDWRIHDASQVQIVQAQKAGTAPAGKTVNSDTRETISWGRQFFREAARQQRSGGVASEVVGNIGEIIEKAVYFDSSVSIPTSKSKMDNTAFMHHLYALVDYDGSMHLEKLYVEEAMNNKGTEVFSRAYTLKDIKKVAPIPNSVLSPEGGLTGGTGTTIISVSDLWDLVKQYDPEFSPKESSKVVENNGFPKIMFHGTSSYGFDFFDTYGSKFGLFGYGSYFTDDPDVADSYQSKGRGTSPGTYAVYLNIKNPLDMDAQMDSKWADLFRSPDADLDASYLDGAQTNEDAFKALKECLADQGYSNWEAKDAVTEMIQGMGFDGITHTGGGRYGVDDGTRHQVYIAFEPEQIKSVDNLGTFDKNNPKMRYSISDDELDYLMNDFGDNSESAFERFGGETYDSGTPYVSYDASQRMARDLLSEYGSAADVSDIAAKYRQLSTLTEPVYEWALDVWRGGSLPYDAAAAAQDEILSIASEMADIVIDNASADSQSNEEVREYLRDVLSQKVYVSDADKRDVAMAMGYESWGDLRKARFGVLGSTTSDPAKGIEVADIYNGILETFPGAVKGYATEQAGQLAEIIEAYDNAREARDSEFNPLEAERERYREEIAGRIYRDLHDKAVGYADEQHKQELALEQARARRLERQARESEKKAAEAKSSNADPKLIENLEAEANDLRTEAEDARLMGQTDSETIAEGMAEGGFTPKTQLQLWEEQSNAKDGKTLTAQERMDQIVKEILDRNNKTKQTKVSRTYSNTLVGGGFISEAEQGIEGLRAEDATYDVVSEKESLSEAKNRLDKNYVYWYDELPKREKWSGKDLDTAMLIFGQVQSESATSGDYSESIRWAQLIREKGTQGGQFLQAFRKYTKTTIGQVIDKTKDLDERYINEKGDNAALDDLRKQNKKAAKDLDQLTIDNEKLDKEYEELMERYNALRSELEEARKERNSTKGKILRAIDKTDALDKENIRLQGELDRLEDLLSWKLAEVSTVSRENRNLVVQSRRLASRLQRAQQRLSDASSSKTPNACVRGFTFSLFTIH